MDAGSIGVFIPFAALSIPIIAIIFSHKRKSQDFKIRELELKKELLELEIKKQDSRIKMLEAENRNLDKIINE